MARTNEIKKRIDAVASIGSITNAMYLVSMAKLQKHQKRIEILKKYDDIVQNHISEIIAALEYIDETFTNPLLRLYDAEKVYDKVAYIVYTSDFGLCGGYNANVIKALSHELTDEDVKEKFVYMVGKMGVTKAHAEGIELFKTLEGDSDVLRYSQLRDGIVDDIIERYTAGEFDAVRIVYTEYKNPLVQEVQTTQILPLVPRPNPQDDDKKYPDFVEFEPNRNDVLTYLIKKNIKTSAYIHYLDAQTSEEAIRRTSMDSANKNGQELIDNLQLIYNRERQAAITQEMAEIIGGSELE